LNCWKKAAETIAVSRSPDRDTRPTARSPILSEAETVNSRDLTVDGVVQRHRMERRASGEPSSYWTDILGSAGTLAPPQ
jgi:hypothetical protein